MRWSSVCLHWLHSLYMGGVQLSYKKNYRKKKKRIETLIMAGGGRNFYHVVSEIWKPDVVAGFGYHMYCPPWIAGVFFFFL